MTTPGAAEISPRPLGELRTVPVLDSHMAYAEVGVGDPIVFLHGNPTSSYLWRNVMPHLQDLGRCLAPDLIGMGGSGPAAEGRYRFVDHRRYLDAWLESVDVDGDVTFVVHDWGSALGFDWLRRHPTAGNGVAYMEAIVCPVTWDDFPGSILVGRQRDFARSWPNQQVVTVRGSHFIQEDSSHEIGEAIHEWLEAI